MRHDIAMKACHCLTRLHYFYNFYSHRGDSFRTEFSHLGELRSIIPEAVKVMALTATSTKASRREIIRSLDMQKPELITVPPVAKKSLHLYHWQKIGRAKAKHGTDNYILSQI